MDEERGDAISDMTLIHPTAQIDSSAQLGRDVRVGAWTVIGPHVVIGDDSELANHVTIKERVSMGARNRLHAGCVVGGDPQDRKYAGEPTECQIGDDNEIREHVTIHRGTGNGGALTTVGSNNLLMVGSHIAHDCEIGDGVVIANQVMLAGHVKVENHVSIGGGVGVHHYATIGTLSFVGGLARISRDVPPFMIVEGHPAEVRAVNVIGMLRHDWSQGDVDMMKECFRSLFRNTGGGSAQIEELRTRFEACAPIQILCDAIERSAAGTHGRARERMRRDDKWSAEAQPNVTSAES